MIPSFHDAFSPTWLDIQRPIGSVVKVVIKSGAKQISVNTEVLATQKTIDIQQYIRSLMSAEQQSIIYTVEVAGVSQGPYVATRSATQVGESNNISHRVGKTLTDFNHTYVYQGYPRTVSVLEATGIVNHNKTTQWNKCTPSSPFYIRWLNRYGGWDYWMFQKRQYKEIAQKNHDTYSPYIPDYSFANSTDKLLSKEVSEQITIGAEQITKEDWEVLSYIVKSSLVQWYDKDNARWLDIVVDKTKTAMQTDETVHMIEFVVLLPTPQLAI